MFSAKLLERWEMSAQTKSSSLYVFFPILSSESFEPTMSSLLSDAAPRTVVSSPSLVNFEISWIRSIEMKRDSDPVSKAKFYLNSPILPSIIGRCFAILISISSKFFNFSALIKASVFSGDSKAIFDLL